jgi:hypothetical protein
VGRASSVVRLGAVAFALAASWGSPARADVPSPSRYEGCVACLPDDAGPGASWPDGGYYASDQDEVACAKAALATSCVTGTGTWGRCGQATCARYDPHSGCAWAATRRTVTAFGATVALVALVGASLRRRRR